MNTWLIYGYKRRDRVAGCIIVDAKETSDHTAIARSIVGPDYEIHYSTCINHVTVPKSCKGILLSENEIEARAPQLQDHHGLVFAHTKDDDDDFLRSAIKGMRKSEAEFRACGLTFAWIEDQPVLESAIDWNGTVLKQPSEPCNRIIRFNLIRGGQIRVTEKWRWCQHKESKLLSALQQPYLPKHFCANANARTKHGLIRTKGWISPGQSLEMETYAVAFPNAPQTIVDRVAATFRKIDNGNGPDRDRFYALLDGSAGCSFCGRPLTEEVSKLIGVDPDCARQNKVPHSMAAANKRLDLRRHLLGEEKGNRSR